MKNGSFLKEPQQNLKSNPKPKNKRKKRKKKQKPLDLFAHVSREIGDVFKDAAGKGAKPLKSGHYIKIFT